MKAMTLAGFFQDLSNILESGLSLRSALLILAETASKELRQAAARMAGSLTSGISIGAIFAAEKIFPSEVIMVVTAGERSGQLPKVFHLLSDYFTFRADTGKKVGIALLYPCVVLGILLCAFLYMALEVFPKVAVLFSQDIQQGLLTRGMLLFAGFLKAQGAGVMLFVMVITAGLFIARMLHKGFFASLCRKIPFIGNIIKEQDLALGFFTLSMLQQSGVSLDRALSEAGRVAGKDGHLVWERCRSYVAGGLLLSESFRRDMYFPRIAVDTIRIAEESGRYIEYFDRLYRFFSRSCQQKIDVLVSGIRPALLLGAAGFIALIAFGFLQPLYGNLSSIGRGVL